MQSPARVTLSALRRGQGEVCGDPLSCSATIPCVTFPRAEPSSGKSRSQTLYTRSSALLASRFSLFAQTCQTKIHRKSGCNHLHGDAGKRNQTQRASPWPRARSNALKKSVNLREPGETLPSKERLGPWINIRLAHRSRDLLAQASPPAGSPDFPVRGPPPSRCRRHTSNFTSR